MDYKKMKKAELVELAQEQAEELDKLKTDVEPKTDPPNKYLVTAVVIAAAEFVYIMTKLV